MEESKMHPSEQQRRYFRTRMLDDKICREICLWFTLGLPVKEIHEWVIDEKGIRCTENAVRRILKRKRWRRLMSTLVNWEELEPWLKPRIQKYFDEKLQGYIPRWNEFKDRFLDALATATHDSPPSLENFRRAAEILRDLYPNVVQELNSRLSKFARKVNAFDRW